VQKDDKVRGARLRVEVLEMRDWWDEPEFIKVQDSMVLDSMILNKALKIIFFPDLIEQLKAETDFTEHEIKFNSWRLLGEGKLLRVNGFYIMTAPDYLGYSFTVTPNARTRGL